jgi:RNA 3'-terminal phosphate cyclase-like protein
VVPSHISYTQKFCFCLLAKSTWIYVFEFSTYPAETFLQFIRKSTYLKPPFRMDESLLSRKKLHFDQGSNYFRQRLVLAILSARPVKITEIRSTSPFSVGVSDYEVSFIHLLDKLSNGSRFKISETGTEVNLIPGALLGGSVAHDCHTSRPLSYYLEPILLLAPFCKKPLRLTLKGRLQNDSVVGFNSVYKLKHAALPIMEIFGLEPDIQVN